MTLGGSGGGGSSGERVEGTSRAGKVYSIPARTRYLESVLGNYGTPGLPDTGNANATANSGTYVLTAVGFDGTRTTLQTLNGGLGGKSAIDGTNQFGAAGAASPDGSLTGGAGGTSLTVRPADPNYTTQMTADIAAGGVIRGAPGGGGGRGIQGARVDPAGRGAQGSPCDASGTPTGINAMGATTTAPNYASDGGAGGNAVATPAVLNGAPGYGQAYQTPPSNNPTTLLRGGGGSGGSSGNPGTTGAPGYAILTEVWASSSATAVQRQEMLAGPKTFPTAFIGFHEKTGSTSAYLAHGPCLLRTVNAEIQNGINNAGVTYGAESPWAAIEGKWPPTTGNRLWTGYDAYMSWANTAGHKVLVTFFQCAPGAAATPLSEAAATFTTTGATAGATSVPVSAVAMNVANGTVIKFASGKTVTLTAGYTSGGTSFTCSALAATLANGDTADLFRDNYGCHGGRYPPTSWSLLTNHVVAFLSRYTALYPGLIKFVECHNEPNFFFVGDELDMVDWQKTVYDAVKSVDSSIQVISPGAINGGYGPMTYMPIARAFGRVNTSVQGWQTCDLIGSHNYDTKPNELLGNGLAQPNKPYLQNSEVGILNTRAWHAALGGSITTGFVETEMGADQYASSLTDAQLCCTISSLAISAWLEGAPAFCFYMRPGDIGPVYWGANCVANFDSVCSRLIPFMGGQSCISALWVGDPTYPYYVITRADGARQSFGVADYTGAAPSPPPPPAPAANFAAQSTAADVVWAHGPNSSAEVTAFATGYDTSGLIDAGPPIHPRFTNSAPWLGNAIEFLALGALITTDVLAANGTTQTVGIDDRTYWPDPAAGQYFVHTIKPGDLQRHNVWKVTALTAGSGTAGVLTITYQAMSGQPLAGSQIDWLVSDNVHIGHQSQVGWSRPVSALKADSTGRGSDDINRPGLPLRSLHDSTNFPFLSTFAWGFYAHPDYKTGSNGYTNFDSWRPSDYGGSDPYLRTSNIDGPKFYAYWRKVTDQRYALNTGVDINDNSYGHKGVAFQGPTTNPQQLALGEAWGGNLFQIPSTPNACILELAKYTAGGGLAGGIVTRSGSAQPGGHYNASAQYATSFLPAGKAFEVFIADCTSFLLCIEPGHSSTDGVNHADTKITLWACRQGETVWTLIISVTDEPVIMGSSGPTEQSWATSIAGYSNFFALFAYLNVELGNLVPKKSYKTWLGQILLSQGPVAPPNDWPITIPAATSFGLLSSSKPQDVAVSGSGWTIADMQAALVKSLGEWSTAAISKIYDANGALTDIRYVSPSLGGHGDTGCDADLMFSLSTGLWSLLNAPRQLTPVGPLDVSHGEDMTLTLTATITTLPAAGDFYTAGGLYYQYLGSVGSTHTWGGDGLASSGTLTRYSGSGDATITYSSAATASGTRGRPMSTHGYGGCHGLNSNEPNGPAVMRIRDGAAGQGAKVIPQAHILHLLTGMWERWGAPMPGINPFTSVIGSIQIKDTLRQRWVVIPSDNGTDVYLSDYTQTPSAATWTTATMPSPRIGNWGSVDSVSGLYPYCNIATGIYDPVFDVFICGLMWGSVLAANNLYIIDPVTWTQTLMTTTGTGPQGMGGCGLTHRKGQGRLNDGTDEFVVFDTSTQPPTGVFKLRRPASGGAFGTWTWSRESRAGSSTYHNESPYPSSYDRLQWIDEMDAGLCQGAADQGMEIVTS